MAERTKAPTIESMAAGMGEHGRKALEWCRHAGGCPVCSSVEWTEMPEGLCAVGTTIFEVYQESRQECRRRAFPE